MSASTGSSCSSRLSAVVWTMLVVLGVGLLTTATARPARRASLTARAAQHREQVKAASDLIDSELDRLWQRHELQPSGVADDLAVLRRLSLALHGTIPSLEELRRFESDQAPDRLARWTDDALNDPRFASYFSERLARSFVGVDGGQFLIFRRDRFKDWLARQLEANTPYDVLVRDMLGSAGVWTSHGEINFITAAYVNEAFEINTLATRTVRAFLGQRIDCAQCHDHPFDRWKQHDFEGLAAFFSEIQLGLTGVTDRKPVAFVLPASVEPLLSQTEIGSQIRSLFEEHKITLGPQTWIRAAGDHRWIIEEPSQQASTSDSPAMLTGLMPNMMAASPAEAMTAPSMSGPNPAAGRPRYVLRKTEAGIEVHPREAEYFVQDTKTLSDRFVEPQVHEHPEWLPAEGTRRDRLAHWITHRDNARFDRTTVNRVWALMFGQPFATDRPVDDLPDPGSDEDLILLDRLGQQFRDNGRDLKWLIRTIALSRAFRLPSVYPKSPDATAEASEQIMEKARQRWAVFPLIRLRPEQVIGSMLQASHVQTISRDSHLFIRFLRLVRENNFINEYGDPGIDELESRSGTIPQALLRMNGEFTRDLIEVNPLFAPGRIALTSSSTDHMIEMVYLACLTRRPTEQELCFFRDEADVRIEGQGKPARAQLVEDLYWTLFNSIEFSWNH